MLADHARHRRGAPACGANLARMLGVDALQREGETVGVALAADLAVGDDVDAGAFHVADREDRGVVLRLLPAIRRGMRQMSCACDARHAVRVPAWRGPPASRAADSCRPRWWAADGWDRASWRFPLVLSGGCFRWLFPPWGGAAARPRGPGALRGRGTGRRPPRSPRDGAQYRRSRRARQSCRVRRPGRSGERLDRPMVGRERPWGHPDTDPSRRGWLVVSISQQ